MAFGPGTRVKIGSNCAWAKGALGTIAEPPNVVRDADGRWGWLTKSVPALNGSRHFYWVRFDTPQYDADGDGPYAEGAMDALFLELADPHD